MRINEIISESASGGATSAGAVATVNVPVGGMRRRGVYGEGGNYGEAPPELKRQVRQDRLGEEISKGPSPSGDAVRYEMDGGYIDIIEDAPHSPVTSSVLSFEVDESRRGQGIGQKLLQHVSSIYPDLGGQVSSQASVAAFYKTGFRTPGMADASFEDHMQEFREYDSLLMTNSA